LQDSFELSRLGGNAASPRIVQGCVIVAKQLGAHLFSTPDIWKSNEVPALTVGSVVFDQPPALRAFEVRQ
ncbi:MAG: hypothetical protein WBW73_18475, partial [Rhodoplanes sp.]